ncbi:transposase [Hymenobacter sp. BT18]|nr:transposase [Hymenobacter sp. BT18]
MLINATYRGRFAQHLLDLGLTQQISTWPPTQCNFVPMARRWVTERTFAWLACFRRIVRDYEFTPTSHVA